MRKIKMIAGYYEWLLYVDDNLLLVENDNDWGELFTTKEELKAYIDNFIVDFYDNVARGIMETNNENFNTNLWLSLTDDEIVAIKEAIYNKWLRYCD